MRLELTFPAKGHYNGFKIFRIYIPYWITRLSFSVRLLTKIRIHISETFLKRFRLYFQWIISNAQTENLKNIMLWQAGQSVLSAKKGEGQERGLLLLFFWKEGGILSRGYMSYPGQSACRLIRRMIPDILARHVGRETFGKGRIYSSLIAQCCMNQNNTCFIS